MKMSHLLLAAAALALSAPAAMADPLLTQGFETGESLDGWLNLNQTTPTAAAWFSGNTGVFEAQAGNAYFATNFYTATDAAPVIDNWLITPELTLTGQTTLSFYTKAEVIPNFSDTLQVLFGTVTSAGTLNFTQTLLTIGGASGAYTDTWTLYTATVDLVGSGRFAFHYVGDYNTSNYVGIDTISVNAVSAVPEPSTYLMFGAGLALLGLMRRKNSKARLAGAGMALAAFGMAPLAQAADPAPTVKAAAGMVVVRDAVSGELRAPTAAEFQTLQAQQTQQTQPAANVRLAAPAAAAVVTGSDGTESVSLGTDSMVYSMATRGDNGAVVMQCVTGADAATAVLNGSAKLSAGEEHNHAN